MVVYSFVKEEHLIQNVDIPDTSRYSNIVPAVLPQVDKLLEFFNQTNDIVKKENDLNVAVSQYKNFYDRLQRLNHLLRYQQSIRA